MSVDVYVYIIDNNRIIAKCWLGQSGVWSDVCYAINGGNLSKLTEFEERNDLSMVSVNREELARCIEREIVNPYAGGASADSIRALPTGGLFWIVCE